MWARIAQSVQRLSTAWTVRRSNPGGGRKFLHPVRLALGPPGSLYKGVPGLSRG